MLLCDSVQVDSEMEVSENQANSNSRLMWMLSSGEAGEDSVAAAARVCFYTWPGAAMEPDELSARHQQAVSFLEDNYNDGTKPVQPLGSTVTFHAGVIRVGTRPARPQMLHIFCLLY